MGDTSIEWTDKTWNPVTGCSKISQGCKNCYAERWFPRVYGRDVIDTKEGDILRHRTFTDVLTHAERLDAPLHWKKPQRVFVNSMSDLFHEAVPDGFISEVFLAMQIAQQHTFQVLTKRPKRMVEFFKKVDTTFGGHYLGSEAKHIHLGVSVEDQETADERIPLLFQTPAAVRFISYEPALGPVDLHDIAWPQHRLSFPATDDISNARSALNVIEGTKLDWVICGGESGPNARPFNIQWARDVIAQCKAFGVACFVKQLGARPFVEPWRRGETDFNDSGRVGDFKLKDRAGGDWDEWPEDLKVREFPN